MSKHYPFGTPMPRFSVGDVVNVKIGPIGVMTPCNWEQGKVTRVTNYLSGYVYTVKSFDGAILKAEEYDLQPADV